MDHPHSAGHPVFSHVYLCTAKYERLSQGVSEEFIDAIICHGEALMSIFQPKTLVARAGERAYNWYVIISGNLDVLDNAGNLVRRHSKGSTLGDKGIIGIPQVISCSVPFTHPPSLSVSLTEFVFPCVVARCTCSDCCCQIPSALLI